MTPQSLLAAGFYFGQRDIAINIPGFDPRQFERAGETLTQQPPDFFHTVLALRDLGENLTLFEKACV